MARVKICGITNYKDARAAIDLGANALGFNFYNQSPRFVSVETAKEIIRQAPASAWFVGVFVNEERERIIEIAKEVGLDTLQFHGDETPEFCSDWNQWRTIKAIRVGSESDLAAISQFHEVVDHCLIDSRDTRLYGGTGLQVESELLENEELRSVLSSSILAGGLSPKNVAEQIVKYKPFGVDVASGVEIAPGKKSFQQMKAFIQAVRDCSSS